jgi:hypothetical protein
VIRLNKGKVLIVFGLAIATLGPVFDFGLQRYVNFNGLLPNFLVNPAWLVELSGAVIIGLGFKYSFNSIRYFIVMMSVIVPIFLMEAMYWAVTLG